MKSIAVTAGVGNSRGDGRRRSGTAAVGADDGGLQIADVRLLLEVGGARAPGRASR